ncbi:MAG: efflux RND transporter periplasmic adaptor subunit [Acidobacteria bacterium]|nr:efflux RND transporter periplasmic adaptor subunit [Acidobacteriota bacterium]
MAFHRRNLYVFAGIAVALFVPLIFFVTSQVRRNANGLKHEFQVRRGTIDRHYAARGRVEGATSQEIKLAARTFGRVLEVNVTDGDPVRKGQVVAVLENNDARARVDEARAAVAQAQAALEKLLNGARPEERNAVRAEMEEAQAAAENARLNYDRMRNLFREGGVVSQAALDRAERDWKVGQAQMESARQRYDLIMAPPRSEDVAAARAEGALARARLAQAQDYYENTFVRSPVEGIVIKRFMNPGESISYESLYQPIVSVADTTRLMVRVEVDETDIGKVEVGQRVEIRCDAFPGRTFYGRVERISGGLGRKKIQTDNPLEKVDTEILETFVELEPGSPLRIGLRVDVDVPLERKENVLIVPLRAVELADGLATVRVKTAAGLREQPVRVGSRDGMYAEILEGLEEGDVVMY